MPATVSCYPSLICLCPLPALADDAQIVLLTPVWIVPPRKLQGNLLTADNSRKDAKSKVLGCCFMCLKDLLDIANYTAYQSKRSGCYVMVYPFIHA